MAAVSWQQSAFRAGALPASLPTMTITEPVLAAILGIVVLGETVRTDRAGLFALAVAAAVMVLATAAPARCQATADQQPSGERAGLTAA